MEGEPKNSSHSREREKDEDLVNDSLDVSEENPSGQSASYEVLNQATASARVLEGFMKEREGFSKQLFTPTQAEAFSHTFEMASESVKQETSRGSIKS